MNCLFLCIACGSYSQENSSVEDVLEKEYEFWKGSDSLQNPQLLFDKALVQKELGLYDDALYSLQRGRLLEMGDSLQVRYVYETSLIHYLKGGFDQSLWELKRYASERGDLYTHRPLVFMTLLSSCETGKFRDLDSVWRTYKAQLVDDTLMASLILTDTPKMKDPAKARRLSSIFPGLGQFYVGKAGAGISSVTLTGLGILYMVGSYVTGYPITATLTGITSTFRFYIGGRRNASIHAKNQNEQAVSDYSVDIKQRIFQVAPHFLSSQ